MSKTELSSLDIKALEKEVGQLKKELFNLKLNASTMHIKDYSQFKKLKKRIAQAYTLINQRKQITKPLKD